MEHLTIGFASRVQKWARNKGSSVMEITEVRIKLMEDSDDRLQGFCSITFDDSFVVRDLKIIEGTSGPFVAMPSRKLTGHCHNCGSKNHLKANYCNQCGNRQRETTMLRDSEGRAKLYADIAHPINSACREMIQSRVIAEYRTEQERAKQPGYMSRYDDDYDDDIDPVAYTEERRGTPAGMPAGSHVEPAQKDIPAPHISAPHASPSQGVQQAPPNPESAIPGPHLPPAPSRQTVSEEVKREQAPSPPPAPPKNKGFGEGIF
jgi:stage V sporulation protein G